MVRLTLLWSAVAFLAALAFRDWFRALCGLILLMAVVEHPDMPKTILGVQGLNPWNVLLAVILVAWARSRRREGLRFDLPPGIAALLVAYLGVVVAAFARMMADPEGLEGETTASLVSEHLVNVVKWALPGLLLYDGCRTERRFRLALASALGVYLLLALQVARWIPPQDALDAGTLTHRARKLLLNEVGYHAVNLSMLLAGASWAILSTWPLVRTRLRRAGILAAAALVLYAQALTAGRMGYATWAVVGAALGAARWRGVLLALPVAVAAVVWIVPGAADRMLEGFDLQGGIYYDEAAHDDAVITSGRAIIWPYVVDEIGRAPLLGHGRLAMARTGLAAFLLRELHEEFPHPHNAYLEMLLDGGVVGLAAILPFYLLVLHHALRLLRDPADPIRTAAGGVAAALVLALLVGALGSQTFYPREGAVGMWCAIGLMLRVWVDARAGDARAGDRP